MTEEKRKDAEIKMQMAKDILVGMFISGREKKIDKPVETACLASEKIFNRFKNEES